jgi:5-methylcytosine-specific restriction endonuclease McrA
MSRTALRRKRAPKLTPYQQRLRHPRWQRKRLEIFERDGWRCQECRAQDKELQVHHRWYVRGAMPWEVPTVALVTLCVDCHRKKSKKRD